VRTVVPTPSPGCPATRALQIEGIDHDEHLCTAPTAYGKLLTALWDSGEPFVIVEWDILPWPGAITELAACSEPWCGFPYPTIGEGSIIASMGCTKLTPAGPAPTEWRSTAWPTLDCTVGLVLAELHGGMHLHGPPVAHLALRHTIS
jgi:hypothetical protein